MIMQEEEANYFPGQKAFQFKNFEFTSDVSQSATPVPMKTFVLEIFETDPKNGK